MIALHSLAAVPGRFLIACALTGLLALVLPAWAAGSAADSGGADEPLVLVELFTSQGCSSCPPADRLLSKLVAEQRVIGLAFHVDYWNYIGWTDPFSAAEWSERQRGYGAVFGAGRIYTPQLVVNGRWEGVGSDQREVEGLLRRAAGGLVDEVELTVEDKGELLAATLAVGAAAAPRHAWLAVAESGFETPVGRGENAHRTLANDNVVRRLEPVALEGARGTIQIPLDPAWRRGNVRLVAFLQDPDTLAITGATQVPLR